MKLSKLQKMLGFSNSATEIERLLYECNREGLIHTTINFHSCKGEGSMTFNPEAQVAENLFTFGTQLKAVFQRVVETTSRGRPQRLRVFQKVKEKLDQEAAEMQKQKQDMLEVQQQLADQKAKEKLEQERQRQADTARKLREQEE